MKKILLVFSMMFATMISVIAQDAPAKPSRGEGRRGEMKAKATQIKKELDLSDSQVAQVKELSQWYRGTVQSIRTNDALSKAQKKQQLKDAQAKREEKIKSILSPEQNQKWESIRAKAKAERAAQGEGRKRNPHKEGKKLDRADELEDLN